MDTHPYHHYLFFDVSADFYQLLKDEQDLLKIEFEKLIGGGEGGHGASGAGDHRKDTRLILTTYATLGFKTRTTFMLWCRGAQPNAAQDMLRELLRTKLGKYLSISYTYFGMVRNSEYSGRTGKPEQVMQTHEERLSYFVLYPFTKTHEWHALEFDARKAIMGQHIKVGVGHPAIRQCLLYSYGVDDHEFLVSYEMKTLEEFQDLVIEMRRTAGRKYTLVDMPTFTCIYKTLTELMAWL